MIDESFARQLAQNSVIWNFCYKPTSVVIAIVSHSHEYMMEPAASDFELDDIDSSLAHLPVRLGGIHLLRLSELTPSLTDADFEDFEVDKQFASVQSHEDLNTLAQQSTPLRQKVLTDDEVYSHEFCLAPDNHDRDRVETRIPDRSALIQAILRRVCLSEHTVYTIV